ncbi:membrane protein [Streptococcus agalactiae]|uniref:ABC transporter permease n=1 Tax=Streptococcus agalactiae TaxID=1311 RepID=UPI000640408F|nr:ABC transporter permease [Streptococcus agalactiae]KLL46542.1 membrane protein [Streptococcus agalactiae]
MKALIINELEKIIKSKIGYVFLLSAGLLIWMNITMYDPKEGVWNIDSFYTFPASLLDIYMQILIFFIPILANALVTKDLVAGTMKLSILKEPSRIKNLVSKQIAFTIFCIMATTIFVLLCYLFGILYFKNMSDLSLIRPGLTKASDLIYTFLTYGKILLPTITYGLLSMSIGLFIENVSLANIISIVGLIFFFNTSMGEKFTMIKNVSANEFNILILASGILLALFLIISNIYLEKKDVLY